MKPENRRATAYDRDQHDLICSALETSNDPNTSFPSAYDVVMDLQQKANESKAWQAEAEKMRRESAACDLAYESEKLTLSNRIHELEKELNLAKADAQHFEEQIKIQGEEMAELLADRDAIYWKSEERKHCAKFLLEAIKRMDALQDEYPPRSEA
jgi:hypothetical protein